MFYRTDSKIRMRPSTTCFFDTNTTKPGIAKFGVTDSDNVKQVD